MYSPKIVEQSLAKFAKSGQKLVRNDIPLVEEWTSRLAKLWDDTNEGPKRKFTPEESAFVTNERLMCSIDYAYWRERYCWIIDDKGGGLIRFKLWDAQEVVLKKIRVLEELMWEASARGEPVDGILLAQHKARQLGATMLARSLIMHRVTTTPYTRAITASIDDEKVDALSLRDKRILDNLPWWLRPTAGWDVKGKHRTFPMLDCSLTYQKYSQSSGLGQGEQFEMGHMTEAASHPYPIGFRHDYFPAIPQSTSALHILETTAQGRDNWWMGFTEEVRTGATPRWRFVFVPWYVERSKYRRTPPEGWKPDELSLHQAHKIYDTSLEYLGYRVMIPLDQLYWWESTRAEYQRENQLHIFYTNYPTTVEESFQHSTPSAFSPELLEHFRSLTGDGLAMEFRQMESK